MHTIEQAALAYRAAVADLIAARQRVVDAYQQYKRTAMQYDTAVANSAPRLDQGVMLRVAVTLGEADEMLQAMTR